MLFRAFALTFSWDRFVGLHEMETACTKRGLQGLIKKLYKEFMILGLISFAIFIVSELYNFDPYDEWYALYILNVQLC